MGKPIAECRTAVRSRNKLADDVRLGVGVGLVEGGLDRMDLAILAVHREQEHREQQRRRARRQHLLGEAFARTVIPRFR